MAARRLLVGILSSKLITQSAAQAAQPSLYAATVPGVDGGQFYGPDRLGELRGHPTLRRSDCLAANALAAALSLASVPGSICCGPSSSTPPSESYEWVASLHSSHPTSTDVEGGWGDVPARARPRLPMRVIRVTDGPAYQ